MFNNGIRLFGALASLTLLSACSGPPSTKGDEPVSTTESALGVSEVTFDVALRGTGSATIHAHVYNNPTRHGWANVLAVHGLSETGFIYAPLAQAIFAEPGLSRRVKRIIAIDLPGHGDSSFPANLPFGLRFGDLAIDDNVGVVVQSIDALRWRGLAPSVVFGHSMGGLEIQAAQQDLLSLGSSLVAHGVFGAVLFAPVPPHGQQWIRPPSGDATPFIVNDPALGQYLLLPPQVFLVAGAFTTLSGQLATNAPTPAQIAAGRYVGPEPLNTLLQLTEATVPLPTGGSFTFQRPSVSAGAFALRHGTLLSIVSFSQDVLVPAINLGPLYEYLTEDTHDVLYRPVSAPDAVHAMLISNPAGLLEAIESML
jgi:pimeloyl-ACP methyl ester carboxylesterase